MSNKGAPSFHYFKNREQEIPCCSSQSPKQEIKSQLSQVWWDSEFSALLMAEGKWGVKHTAVDASHHQNSDLQSENISKYSKLVESSPFLIDAGF